MEGWQWRFSSVMDDTDLLQFVWSHRSAWDVLDCLSPGRLIYKVEQNTKSQMRMHGALTDLLDTCLKMGPKNLGFHGHDVSIRVTVGTKQFCSNSSAQHGSTIQVFGEFHVVSMQKLSSWGSQSSLPILRGPGALSRLISYSTHASGGTRSVPSSPRLCCTLFWKLAWCGSMRDEELLVSNDIVIIQPNWNTTSKTGWKCYNSLTIRMASLYFRNILFNSSITQICHGIDKQS